MPQTRAIGACSLERSDGELLGGTPRPPTVHRDILMPATARPLPSGLLAVGKGSPGARPQGTGNREKGKAGRWEGKAAVGVAHTGYCTADRDVRTNAAHTDTDGGWVAAGSLGRVAGKEAARLPERPRLRVPGGLQGGDWPRSAPAARFARAYS